MEKEYWTELKAEQKLLCEWGDLRLDLFSWSDAAEKWFTVLPHKIAVMQESNPCSVSTIVFYHIFLAQSASFPT